jgi:acyl-CoA thioester hydrolase
MIGEIMDAEIAAMLSDFPVVITLPVQWGDQDAFQHVNNTVYFRWYESSRIAYSARIGLGEMMRQHRIGPILASATCDFRRSITFPDTVHVGARITRIGRTSLTMEHTLVSAASRSVAALGRSTLVVFDYNTGNPFPVPEPIRAAIKELEGTSLQDA